MEDAVIAKVRPLQNTGAPGIPPARNELPSEPRVDRTPPTEPRASRSRRCADRPSTVVPAISDVLAGQYHVERWLGDGGMGLVLAARDLKLERDVALKLVQPELLCSSAVRRSFEAETRTMAAL